MTASKYEPALQVMEDLDANDPNTSSSDAVSALGRVLIELASDFVESGSVDGVVEVSSVGGVVAVSDNGGSLTVDGSVSIAGAVPVTDNNDSLSVDDNGGSLTVDGAVAITGSVPVTDDGGSLTVDDGGSSLTVDGSVGIVGTVPVTDNGGSLTVDGTVAITGAVAVTDNSGSLTVDDGGGSLTVDGTVAVSSVGGTVAVTDNGGTLTVDDGGSSLTVDGTVAVSAVGGTVVVGDGGGSITVDGTVAISGAVPVTDNGGSLTVDGTVAVSSVGGTVAVTDNSGTLTVDDGGLSLTVDGTVAVSAVGGTVVVGDGGGALSVDDNGGSLTVDGTVAVSAVGGTVVVGDGGSSLSVDDNGGSLTVDGTLTVTDGGGSITVDGTVAVSSLPALPTGSNTIGKLAANSGVDIGDVDARVGHVQVVSTTPLTPSGTASSSWLSTDGYGTLIVHVRSNVVGQLRLLWSAFADGGVAESDTPSDNGDLFAYGSAVARWASFRVPIVAPYVQVLYDNGGTVQAYFALAARFVPEYQEADHNTTIEHVFDLTPGGLAEIGTALVYSTDGFGSVVLHVHAGVASAANGIKVAWFDTGSFGYSEDTVQKFTYSGAVVGDWMTIPLKVQASWLYVTYTNGGSPLTDGVVVMRFLESFPTQPVSSGQSLSTYERALGTLVAGSDGTSARFLKTLTDGKLTVDVGSWIGDASPTVGQKTAAASIPVAMASDVVVAVGGLGPDDALAELSAVPRNNKTVVVTEDMRVIERLDELIAIGSDVRELLLALVARL